MLDQKLVVRPTDPAGEIIDGLKVGGESRDEGLGDLGCGAHESHGLPASAVGAKAWSVAASSEGRESRDGVVLSGMDVEVSSARADGDVRVVPQDADGLRQSLGVVLEERGDGGGFPASRHEDSLQEAAFSETPDCNG